MTAPSLAERLVDRLSGGVFARATSSRRGFLGASVLAGTAFAVDPWGYLTRPADAYSTVCGPGAECNDGWSAFCCTINHGSNTCPPGSFVGGWWKADNSRFCCGSARYYIDCNARCGSDWKCHCAHGSCDKRRVACNQFRYGQCNQQISCYGPVVCRVVSCAPPWKLDHSCTTASATDNATVSHSAPCLPGKCSSELTKLYEKLGDTVSVLGRSTSGEKSDGHGGRYITFQHGAIYDGKHTSAHEVHGAIYSKYHKLGGPQGRLGYPVSSEQHDGAGGARNHFQHGIIEWSKKFGAHALWGVVLDRWLHEGGAAGRLGHPLTDFGHLTHGGGVSARFQQGYVFWGKATGARIMTDPIHHCWSTLGGSGSPLGYPTADERSTADHKGRFVHFQHGAIYSSPGSGTHGLWGALYTYWAKARAEQGRFGYPVSSLYVVGNESRVQFVHVILARNNTTGTIREIPR